LENSLTACNVHQSAFPASVAACIAVKEERIEAHKFISILIHRQMYRTKATSAYLLLDDVLVDPVDSAAIIVATAIM
jgi:hypothetical protein